MGEPVRLPRSSSIASRTRSSTTAAHLKHAVLEGTYVINNPFWWTADDKFFNYSVAAKLGVAMPKTVLLPQKGVSGRRRPHARVAAQPRLSRSTGTGCSTTSAARRSSSRTPAAAGSTSTRSTTRRELLAAYDGTAPYCMTLQQFIHFDQYVRCFTFGKTDIMPVAYDPRERRYLVEHNYLSAELGARIVRDAQTHQPGARLRDEHHRVRGRRTACRTRSTSSTRRPTSSATASRRSTSSIVRGEDGRSW